MDRERGRGENCGVCSLILPLVGLRQMQYFLKPSCEIATMQPRAFHVVRCRASHSMGTPIGSRRSSLTKVEPQNETPIRQALIPNLQANFKSEQGADAIMEESLHAVTTAPTTVKVIGIGSRGASAMRKLSSSFSCDLETELWAIDSDKKARKWSGVGRGGIKLILDMLCRRASVPRLRPPLLETSVP